MKSKKHIKEKISSNLLTTGVVNLQNDTGRIKLNGDYLGFYLKDILLKTKILSQKYGKYHNYKHERGLGFNLKYIMKGMYGSITTEFKDFLMLYHYQGEEGNRVEDSEQTITSRSDLFQIFKKGKKITLVDKLFKYAKYPSIKYFGENLFTDNYLRGSNNEIYSPIFSLELKRQNYSEHELTLGFYNKEFKKQEINEYLETKKNVRNAEQQITNYIGLLKKEYADLEKIIK